MVTPRYRVSTLHLGRREGVMIRFWRMAKFKLFLWWLRRQGGAGPDEWPAYRAKLIEGLKLEALLATRAHFEHYFVTQRMAEIARHLPALSREFKADLVVHIRARWPAATHELWTDVMDYIGSHGG